MASAIGLAVIACLVNVGAFASGVRRMRSSRVAVGVGIGLSVLAAGVLVLTTQPLFGDYPSLAERRWVQLLLVSTSGSGVAAVVAVAHQGRGVARPATAATCVTMVIVGVLTQTFLPQAVPG